MLPPGFSDFESLGEWGRDSTGVLYKARDLRVNRLVTLKLLVTFPGQVSHARQRFLTEARALASVSHPNVAALYEVGERDGCSYLVLESIEGGTLAGKLDGAPWSATKAAELVEALARAAQGVHEAGLVHRDIKPANIWLTAEGTPKVAGFGLVRGQHGEGGGGVITGTPLYMAPEQAAGRADRVGPASDVYALGGVLYELLTGRPPFEPTNFPELLRRVMNGSPAPPRDRNPQVPPDLERICLICLAKNPAQRYPTAGALADDLIRFREARAPA